MSNDDKAQPLKDNTGRGLKPKEAARSDHAPVGSVGTGPKAPGMTPSGNTFSNAQLNQATYEPRTATKEAQKDDRPSFERTGDREVDQFYAQTHRMTDKTDAKEKDGTNKPRKHSNEGPER